MSIFTHVVFGTNDLAAATAFYDATLGALGIQNLGPWRDRAVLYGIGEPEFEITTPANGEPATYANGGTVGFSSPNREAVRRFHEAGVAAGGTDEGTPGTRSSAPNAYGAYLRDLDGNKLCAFCFVEE